VLCIKEKQVEVSFLAEQSHHSKSIAQWYYDEWAKNYNVPFNTVFEDVKSKSNSKK